MSEVVKVEREGAVAVVSLNRPDKLNAMSPDVFAGLLEAGREVESDDAVRAVVVRGEGRAFSSGLDLATLGGFGRGEPGGGRTSTAQVHAGIPGAQRSFNIWASMRKPVVAAVHGYALGAGFQLALACDIRICADDAVLSVFEITYGLVPDLGATQRLPRLVGAGRAKELIWTARKITAQEADRWGIVNRVVGVDQVGKEAMDLAQDLASRPPLPIRYTKELVDLAGRVPAEEGMLGEATAQAFCLTSNDVREAVSAAFEKRPGTYTGT